MIKVSRKCKNFMEIIYNYSANENTHMIKFMLRQAECRKEEESTNGGEEDQAMQ